MRHPACCIASATILVVSWLASANVVAGVTVIAVSEGQVTLSEAAELSAGVVFEVKNGDDLLGFLRAEKDEKGGKLFQ